MPRRYRRRLRVMGVMPVHTPPVDPVVPPVVADPAPGVPPVPPTTPPVPPTDPVPAPRSYDETYVKQLRDEAAKHRLEKKAAEDALAILQRDQLSEQDKVKLDLTKLQTETVPTLERENRQLKVQVAAGKLGIVDPEVASLLVDWNAVNTGTSIEAALEALVIQKPYLKQSAAPVAPAPVTPPVPAPIAPVVPPTITSPGVPPAAPNRSFTKSELDGMSQAQVTALLPEINAAIEGGRVDYKR